MVPKLPETEEEAERLPFRPWEIANLRRVEEKADTLIAMAERYDRWKVFRGLAMKFAIATGALVAGLSAFREDIVSFITFLRGGP